MILRLEFQNKNWYTSNKQTSVDFHLFCLKHMVHDSLQELLHPKNGIFSFVMELYSVELEGGVYIIGGTEGTPAVLCVIIGVDRRGGGAATDTSAVDASKAT